MKEKEYEKIVVPFFFIGFFYVMDFREKEIGPCTTL